MDYIESSPYSMHTIKMNWNSFFFLLYCIRIQKNPIHAMTRHRNIYVKYLCMDFKREWYTHAHANGKYLTNTLAMPTMFVFRVKRTNTWISETHIVLLVFIDFMAKAKWIKHMWCVSKLDIRFLILVVWGMNVDFILNVLFTSISSTYFCCKLVTRNVLFNLLRDLIENSRIVNFKDFWFLREKSYQNCLEKESKMLSTSYSACWQLKADRKYNRLSKPKVLI